MQRRAILSFSILRHDNKRITMNMYRNTAGAYRWRYAGTGTPVRELPVAESIAQAKDDVRNTFPFCVFATRATWL